MPYRRLPKTDQARLHALQKAVQQAGNAAYNDQAINYLTLTEAQRFLMQFVIHFIPPRKDARRALWQGC